jgi:general secretion pathway protein L
MAGWQDALQQPTQQLRRAWRDSPLPGFFAWWTGELKGLLPTRLRAALAGGPSWFLLERQPQGWSLRQAGGSTGVFVDDDLPAAQQLAALRAQTAQVAADDLRIALALPAETVLRRTLMLPLAARSNLRQVAGYEMDRQTPFRLEQVYYGIRELGTPAAAGKVAAQLAVVQRSALDPLLERLGGIGLTIDAIDVIEGSQRVGVDLLPPGRAPHRVNRRRRLNLILGIGAVVLALACMLTWLHNRQSALASMQDEVENLRAGAQKVSVLRQRLAESAGAAGFLAQRKADTVSVLAVLDELTRRLPDDTWLERITVSNTGDLGFQGQSPQAAKLVDALKNAKLVSEPSFQGTIATDPTSGKERFYMVAKVRGTTQGVKRAPQAR